MFDFLRAFNLFPYPHLWRVGKEPFHSDKCSIIVSIILFIGIGALFVQRLVTVYKMETVTATSQTLIDDSPPLTKVNTYQTDPNIKPFMFAFDLYKANPNLNPNDTSFVVEGFIDYVKIGTAGNRTTVYQPFTFEQCQPQHFSNFENINEDYRIWGAKDWLCLPLNKTFEIQGSWTLDGAYSSINVLFNCTGNCSSSFDTLNIFFYTMSSSINPTNSTSPEQFYIDQTTIPLYKNTELEYSFDLVENIIKTDQTVLPNSKIQTTHSFRTEREQFVQRFDNSSSSTNLVYFQRSIKTVVHQRTYLKLLDAVSYVGGMFQAILGMMFFMLIFARIFYQFKFAKKYFRSGIASRSFSLKTLFTQLIYKGISKCKDPDWPESKQRQDMQKTVNHLLDVVYLHKRIDFLERALPILLEEHQLKGLHLVHDLTVDEADKKFKEHQLRDRLVSFLIEKQKEIQYTLENDQFFKWSLFEKDQYQKDMEMMISGQNLKKEEMDYELPQIKINYQKSKGESKMQEDPHTKIIRKKHSRFKDEHIFKKQPSLRKKQTSANVNTLDGLFKGDALSQNMSQLYKNSSKHLHDNFDMLKCSSVNYGRMENNSSELKNDLQTNILKLMEEADLPNGDARSKKIYESLDDWLKMMLKAVVRPKRKGNDQLQMRRKRKNYQDFNE